MIKEFRTVYVVKLKSFFRKKARGIVMKYGIFGVTVICTLVFCTIGRASADKCEYYVQQNEFDTALTVCSDDIDKFNSIQRMADTYINRGLIYIYKNDYAKAIADFSSAIKLNPTDSSYYIKRGKAYFDKDQFGDAVADYTKAIELNPNDATAYNLRGLAFRGKGERDQAMADFKKAVQLNPKYAWPYYRIASMFAAEKRANESCDWLKKASDAGFDRWGYLRNDPSFEPIRNVKCFEEILTGK
jgi:tetratricopeptide (TPR) repeat protein